MNSADTFLILSDQNNTAFNLAVEDVLLNQRTENFIFLYINRPSVVIGKHQNPYAESNLSYCKQNGIGIYRRLSGGGTVFHDEGNINFCFIQNMEHRDRLIDFARFLKPIQEYLQSRHVLAEFSGRNDLLVNGYKVSGNAEHVVQKSKRVIHHGTLLYDSKLETLGLAIRPNPLVRIKSHAVHSVRSRVMNLRGSGDLAETPIDFMKNLGEGLLKSPSVEIIGYSEWLTEVEILRTTKYESWDWNFGYSPHYTMRSDMGNGLELEVNVRKGVIQTARIMREDVEYADLSGLQGKLHQPEILEAFFRDSEIDHVRLPADLTNWF